MRLENSTAYENVYATFADAGEFARELPEWLKRGWRFSDARREGQTEIRVQFTRQRVLTVHSGGVASSLGDIIP